MATATGTDFRSPISLSQAHFDHISPSVRSAFNLCREADQRLCRGGADSVDNPFYPRLVSVRILGHLLRLAPSFGPASDAASRIAKLIFSAKNPDADDGGGLAQLGSFYDMHLIRTFRKFKGPTPQTSSHHSRPSFNRNAQELQELLIEAPRSHSKAKELALIRDGYRCMLSRRMHAPYWEQVFMLVNGGAQAPSLSITECAHIFSESTNMNLDIPDKRGYTAKVWAILEMFGYPSIREELEGSKTHSLENVLTLECNLHRYFDSLKLWLEAIPGSPNRYRIESIYPLGSLRIDEAEVTFASHIQDPLLPLPNPTYLRIQAACCKVARLSGASGLYDKLERDLECDPDPGMPEFASALHARLELIQDHAYMITNEDK